MALSSSAADNQTTRPLSYNKDWETEFDEMYKLLSILPLPMKSVLEQNSELSDLLEIVMDLGRPAFARYLSGDLVLSNQPVTAADLEFAVKQVGDFGGDNRAGIDCTLHRISCIRNRQGKIIGLTCRVGRWVVGGAKMVEDLAISGSSMLFLGKKKIFVSNWYASSTRAEMSSLYELEAEVYPWAGLFVLKPA